MRSLLVISNYAANYGGNFIRSIVRLADAYGANTVFLFPDSARGKPWLSDLDGYNVRFSSFEKSQFGSSCESLRKELGGDILVHTHFVDGLLFGQVKRSFRRVICHQHMAVDPARDILGRAKKALRRALVGKAYEGVTLVAVSQPVADSLRGDYPSAVTTCVPNAIDFSRYDDCPPRGRTSECNLIRALIFGSHFERKGVDIAVESCKKLIAKGIGVELTVSVHDVEECARKIKGLCGGTPPWLHVVPVTEYVGELYARSDVFLSPSRSEAFGYAVVEAAYMGCAVVASDVQGQNTLMGIPGSWWVHPEDVDGLAKAMEDAFSEYRLSSSAEFLGRRDYLKSRYGIGRWVTDMLQIYESVSG